MSRIGNQNALKGPEERKSENIHVRTTVKLKMAVQRRCEREKRKLSEVVEELLKKWLVD